MDYPNPWYRPFIVYMALAGGSFMIYNTFLPIRIFHHIIITVFLLYWFLQYGLPTSPMIFPLGIFLVNVGLSTLYSVDPRIAQESSWHWFVNILLFLMAVDWFRQGRGETVFKWQFIAGGIIVALSLLEWVLYPGKRVHGPFWLTNLTGAYCAAMVIPTLVWARSAENRKKAFPLALLGIGLILVLLAGNNRGAWISLGVGLGAFALLSNIRWLKWSALLTVVLIPFVVGYLSLAQPGHLAGDIYRMDLWRASGEMLVSYPTGVGPGLFAQVFRVFRTIPADNMTGAHNLYFNIGAELGVVGLAAGAAVLLIFLYYIIAQERTLKQNACLAALVGIATHMLVDNFSSQNYSFLVGIYAAYVLYEWKLQPAQYTHLLRSVKNGIIVALVASCFWLLNLDRAQVFYEQSLGGDVAAARMAVALDPQLKLYHIQLDRLLDGPESASRWDRTLTLDTDLRAYGLVVYGRLFR